ncbi:FAD-dependent monooxygenase [Streptomyces sp. NPDC051018]|uniref:FAD-dependent monooxygenase n=1 Tax=Streptomyces sp. NPDC051018 TaxID=3365639 RepID=UPI00378B59D2
MTHFMIAGGGIAGLTTALALHAAGFRRVTVVEAAREIQPVGAGLNIMPNAVRELDALGLLGALERRGLPTRELRYYHRSGALVSREPRGRRAGYRWPQLSIARGDLQLVLADAVRERLGPGSVVGGVRVTAVEQLAGGRPRIQLEHRDGARRGSASLEPDVLIGADGIRSAVRAGLNPGEGEPPWNGMLVWRGVSRVPARQIGDFMFIAGDDRQKAVIYPMSAPDPATGEVLVNWALAMPADAALPGVPDSPEAAGSPETSGYPGAPGASDGPGTAGAIRGPGATDTRGTADPADRAASADGPGTPGGRGRPGGSPAPGGGSPATGTSHTYGQMSGAPAAPFRGDWNRAVPVERFLHHYRGWELGGVVVEDILRAADGAYEYPMVDREPLARWSHGRTTLIGDAAHAMYPIGSNGATQSIVDGRALAHALARHRDPVDGLAAYEADRRPAMTELQRANRLLGPEVVINLAHQRAPGGFTDIDEVIPPDERTEIAARYATAGAFDPESVNSGSPYATAVRPRG